MTFGSAWMLWGAALGAIPIVVHLLHRRRHREVPWAAMRFLLEATRKNSRRIRLEQLILLAVRTMILVLLAVALAQPFVSGPLAGGAVGGREHRVVVLDATFSMLAEEGGESRFERAKRLAADVLRSTTPGDVVNLVLHRAAQPRVLVREPSARVDEVLGELERVEATHESGALADTLREAAALFGQNDDDVHGQLVVIGDLQRLDWDAPGSREEVETILRELSEKARVTLVDVADTSPGNVTVADLRTDADLVTVGEPFDVEATLANHGDEPVDRTVELHVDGRLRERRTAVVPARAERPVPFTLDLDGPGDHVLEVVVSPSDALALDDRRATVVRCRSEINVLLVDGSASTRFVDRATSFLEVALSPDRRGEPWQGVLEPRVVRESELADVDLNRYDCVFLCNVGLMTSREATVLRRYLEAGGGLVVSLGDRVRLPNYNRVLRATEFVFADLGLEAEVRDGKVRVESTRPGFPARRSGLRVGWTILDVDGDPVSTVRQLRESIEKRSLADGIPLRVRDSTGDERVILLRRPPLLPARLESVNQSPSEGAGFAFDASDLTHPIVRVFEGNPAAGLLTTRIPTYVSVAEDSLASSRVALRFSNGDPAIVEGTVGRGRTILVTTAFDRDWGGTWPGWPSFPQMMQELVVRAVSGTGEDALPVGAPFEATFPGLLAETRAEVERPDGRTETARVDDLSDVVTYEDTNRAGTYGVSVGPPVNTSSRFSVALDPTESDLDRTDPRVLSNMLAEIGGAVRTEWNGVGERADDDVGRNPLASWLLGLVGCLLVVETLMAWRFPVGLAALLFVVLAGLTWRLVTGHVLLTLPAIAAVLGLAAWSFRHGLGVDRPAG